VSEPAESSAYFSAVERLRSLISELQEMAEQRKGLQRAPARLWSLLDAISQALQVVRANTADAETSTAARDRELQFDEIADPIFDHLQRQYDDEAQASAAWAHCRRNLRAELDNLDGWASSLLLVLYFLASGLYRNEIQGEQQAS
jgi:hypothetical protein